MTSLNFIELQVLRGLQELRHMENSLVQTLSSVKKSERANEAKRGIGHQLTLLQDHVAQLEQLVAQLEQPIF